MELTLTIHNNVNCGEASCPFDLDPSCMYEEAAMLNPNIEWAPIQDFRGSFDPQVGVVIGNKSVCVVDALNGMAGIRPRRDPAAYFSKQSTRRTAVLALTIPRQHARRVRSIQLILKNSFNPCFFPRGNRCSTFSRFYASFASTTAMRSMSPAAEPCSSARTRSVPSRSVPEPSWRGVSFAGTKLSVSIFGSDFPVFLTRFCVDL
ncbi:hypothetical protein C8R43DRAFT_966365 [Mycena crocata]|nr:hypothetical protein C8R43DRAFT_966365 [Mycena crocata]